LWFINPIMVLGRTVLLIPKVCRSLFFLLCFKEPPRSLVQFSQAGCVKALDCLAFLCALDGAPMVSQIPCFQAMRLLGLLNLFV
jgi:hypothetical protein